MYHLISRLFFFDRPALANRTAGLLFLLLVGRDSLSAAPLPVPGDSLARPHRSARTETVSLLLYNRIIIDAGGNVRFDQNIVPTVRLGKLLKLQVGIRFGERAQNLNAYYHYKAELQTKQFWNRLRFLARMSTNVINNTGPDGGPPYTKSNYLAVAEGRQRLGGKFTAVGGLGYLYSFKHNNDLGGWPVTTGLPNNHLIYKLALHYELNERGFVGLAYGTYDVFNPYNLNQGFAQVDCEYDLSESSTLYTYYRYQENGSFGQPLNHFICLGLRFHFYKNGR